MDVATLAYYPVMHKQKLDCALRNLRNVLQRECALEGHKYIDAVKESTISTPVVPQKYVWSPFSRHIPDARLQSREVEWLSLRSPRGKADKYRIFLLKHGTGMPTNVC